jgi:hypothetical protein
MIATVYFTPKFWPDSKHRFVPLDEHVDYQNPFEVLKHRQEVRLFYRNWVQVWRTYAYLSSWLIGLVPIVYILSNSLWAAGIALGACLVCKIFFTRKLDSWTKFKYLASGLLDQHIVPYLGSLEPFE